MVWEIYHGVRARSGIFKTGGATPPKDKDTTTTYSDLVQKSFDEAQAWDEEVNNYISQQRGIMTHEHEKTFGWRKQSVELVPPIYQLATNTVKHAISEFKSDMFDTISPALPPFIYHKTYLYRFGRLCRIGIYDMLKLNNNIGALIIAYDLPKDHAAAIRHISRWVDNVVAQEYRSYAEDTIRRGDYLLTKKEFRILSLNHLFKHKGLKLNL